MAAERQLPSLLSRVLMRHWKDVLMRWVTSRDFPPDDRPLRLFVCGCVRLAAADLTPTELSFLRLCENFADGQVARTAVEKARRDFTPDSLAGQLGAATVSTMPWLPIQLEIGGWAAYMTTVTALARSATPEDDAAQCNVLVDVLPEFPRPAFDPAWLTWRDGLLVAMARTIYDEHRFTEVPILADAQEEAGCTDPTILDHCRADRPHVRGCWVIDALLGRP